MKIVIVTKIEGAREKLMVVPKVLGGAERRFADSRTCRKMPDLQIFCRHCELHFI